MSREPTGNRAGTAADLQHSFAWPRFGGINNQAHDVAVAALHTALEDGNNAEILATEHDRGKPLGERSQDGFPLRSRQACRLPKAHSESRQSFASRPPKETQALLPGPFRAVQPPHQTTAPRRNPVVRLRWYRQTLPLSRVSRAPSDHARRRTRGAAHPKA